MLFKPWAQVQTPRHLLDELDDANDDEIGEYMPWCSLEPVEVSDKSIELKPIRKMIVISSRMDPHGAIEKFLKSNLSKSLKVCLGVDQRAVKGFEVSDLDALNELYDEAEDESDLTVTSKVRTAALSFKAYYSGDRLVLVVPHMIPQLCHSFAESLLALQPSEVTIIVPCNMTSTEQKYAYYLGSSEQPIFGLERLKVPYMISGPLASLMSLSVRSKIQCDGIVVRADGPTGFEVMDEEAHEVVEKILQQMGINVEPVKGLPAGHSTLYL